MAFSPQADPTGDLTDPETVADKLRADGGHRDRQKGEEYTCISDWPCNDCFIDRERELLE